MLITYPINYSQKILNRIDVNISLRPSCTRDLEYDGLRKKETFVYGVPSYNSNWDEES